MKRFVSAVSLVFAFPLLVVGILFFVNKAFQPQVLTLLSESSYLSTSYLESDKFYEITGKMACVPATIIVPTPYAYESIDSSSHTSIPEILHSKKNHSDISSLAEIRNPEFIVGDNYVASVSFYLNLPAYEDFSLWFPAEFCEYNIYVNGKLMAESPTFRSNSPSFAAPFYVELPASETGMYEVMMNIISPISYINSGPSSILLGTLEKIQASFDGVKMVGFIFVNLIVFTIIYSLIQMIILKRDLRTTSFTLLSIMTLLTMSFMDGRIISNIIPYLPFQLGIVLETISMPLYLATLLFYTDTMFPESFPKKMKFLAHGILIIPILNSLLLKSVPMLNSLSILVTVIPYAVCLYAFVIAYEKQEMYILRYGIGLLSVESSVLLYYSTKSMAIPSRFAYSVGYFIFAVTMVSIIAQELAGQNKEEEFFKGELSRQLAAMQASENAFLNSQMKPHFLYNTLNTIADLCVTDPPKAQGLINSLSEYLKLILSMDSMDETVPLRRELEVVEAYTAIEKERFPSINFYNDFPVRMPVIMMPPLTIQPLIENAIKHGVRKSNKPGAITLRIIENPDSVDFFVSDNGIGMNEESINKLFKVPSGNQSIGIYNIDRRLKRKYGQGLKVESTPNLGTCVSFRILK